MINLLKCIAVTLFSSYLLGCATAKPIPMGNDTYMISQTSAGGIFKAMGSLKAEVMTRANEFAASKNKIAIPIASKESPAYPGHMPNFEYQFKLVDKEDPKASGGSLIPRADVVIEMKGESKSPIVGDVKIDIYTEILKLDDLRKRGLITDDEFESQKSKLLSGN
jgi:hypothetical protein